MRIVRNKTFETNSSSTHSLVIVVGRQPIFTNDYIRVRFVNTDTDHSYNSVTDKLSYLVGHIINNHKYVCSNYDDLLEDVLSDYDFKMLEEYIKNKYGKDIKLPSKAPNHIIWSNCPEFDYCDAEDCPGCAYYKADEGVEFYIDDIVEINHQLVEDSLFSVLRDLLETTQYEVEHEFSFVRNAPNDYKPLNYKIEDFCPDNLSMEEMLDEVFRDDISIIIGRD